MRKISVLRQGFVLVILNVIFRWFGLGGLEWLTFVLLAAFVILLAYRLRYLAREMTGFGASGLAFQLRAHPLLQWLPKGLQDRFPGASLVGAPCGIRDEMGDIIGGYNNLAEKTEDLISLVAEKIAVEKEVQTAEIVQSLFYPASGFESSNLRLAGKVLTATQCAGDWWHYDQVGDHLVVGVGDATGHGVSAALMMAAVHGAYSISMSETKKDPQSRVNLSSLLDYLNVSCQSVSSEENTMTFVGSAIDLRTGKLMVANAAHPAPYILRRVKSTNVNSHEEMSSQELAEIFKPLKTHLASPLGTSTGFVKAVPETFQLAPGDIIFWYSDGLLTFSAKKSVSTGRLNVLRFLANIAEQYPSDPAKICEKVLEHYLTLRTELSEGLVDDVTIVVGIIPPDVKFEAPGSLAS